MDNKVIALMGAVVIIAGVALFSVMSGGNSGPTSQSNTSAENGNVAGQNSYEKASDRTLGAIDAPITMIEYASVTCGHCATFHSGVFKQIEEEYIKTGKVRFIFREFPTAPADRAVAGFMLARCVPEERYFSFIDVLFKQQQKWVLAQDAYAELKSYATLAGLTGEQFDACLRDQSALDVILANQDEGINTYNIEGTPTFVINGKVYSNRSFEQFKTIFDPLLEG